MTEKTSVKRSAEIIGTSSKALKGIAHFISIIFHPIFIPLFLTLSIYYFFPVCFARVSQQTFILWVASIGITTIFFPLFSIALLKPLGFITSYKMETPRERIVPLVITMIFYFWMSHVFESITDKPVPLVLKVLFLGNFWGVILVFLINIFTKISMHTAVAGGIIGIIIVLLITGEVKTVFPLIISILIAGVMGTARMLLGAHQKGDIWLGYIVGILVQLAALVYLRII